MSLTPYGVFRVPRAGTYPDCKSIRPGKRGPSITDGPFIEAKEQLGSFFIVEAADLDEAVRVASLHPAASLAVGEPYGWGIEVRPIQGDGYFAQR